MKRTIHTSAVFALLLGLAACTQDQSGFLPDGAEGTPIVFTATGLNLAAVTPASRATVDGNWQGVPTVAVMVGDVVKEYTVTANSTDGYKSATLTSEDPYYWAGHNPITVSAWWPYTEGKTTLPDVVVKGDQSTRENFAASDYVSAESQTVEFDTPALIFAHRTARVTVELTPGSGFTSVAGATVCLTNLSITNGNPSVIKACNTSGNTHEALVAPQTVAADENFMQVELGGNTFYLRPKDKTVLEAGYRYTYAIKVNATGLTLDICEIGEWGDGGGESGKAEKLDYIYNQETNTYTVYTANGLNAWKEAVQRDRSLNCTLAADISPNENWMSVGNEKSPYTGTFDGGGHTITGLTVNESGTDYVGLIGYLGYGGKVQNLTLDKVNITGASEVGSVVGYNNQGTVANCTVSGNVTATGQHVGGVVGTNQGPVSDCTVSGNVSSTANERYGEGVGGVVGINYGTVTACCHASGNVSSAGGVGGVVGFNYGILTASYHVSGDVKGTTIYIGGVVGGATNGHVIACYHVSGSVTGGSYVGGVMGLNQSGRLTACYNASGSISGSSEVGGVAGGNSGFATTVSDCYWSNYSGDGIGIDANNTGVATKVDGTSVTWKTAVDKMNAAIEAWNDIFIDEYGELKWRYELTGDLPTLVKKDE